jgi:predicted RNA binding protein YcfA (HicA-like mRNA interferase family)
MTNLPSLKAREVLQTLVKTGFYIHHQTGSHARLLHQQKAELRVTVPVHNKDIPVNTLRHIIKQAELTEDEFVRLLRE